MALSLPSNKKQENCTAVVSNCSVSVTTSQCLSPPECDLNPKVATLKETDIPYSSTFRHRLSLFISDLDTLDVNHIDVQGFPTNELNKMEETEGESTPIVDVRSRLVLPKNYHTNGQRKGKLQQ
jgi:hypothetical protein